MADTVDIPTQSVTIEGDEHSFSAIGKVESDGTIEVDVSGPSGTLYSVHLYNNHEQIEDSKRVNGSGHVTFEAGPLAPGTYVVAVEGADGQTKEILPVVVKGYSVEVSHPRSATAGDTVTVNVSLSRVDTSSESVSSVTVAVAQGGEYREITASKVGPETYRATITLEEAGEFGIYAGARGQDTIDDEKQLVGISNRSTISVGTTGDDSSSSTVSPTPSGTGTDRTQTATPSPTSTPPETPTQTATMSPTAVPTKSPTHTSESPAEGVITPAPSVPPTNTTTTTSPLTAIQWVIFLLSSGALVQRLRQQ